MSFEDRGKQAGRAARDGGRAVPPWDAVLARSRRVRAITAAITAFALVLGLGLLALLATGDRPDETEAADTTIATTTTTAPTTDTTGAETTTSTTAETTTTVVDTTTTSAPVVLSPPGYGGVAVIADDQSPTTFNPYGPEGDNFIVHKIGQALWAKALDVEAVGLEIVPDLLTEIPSPDNGGIVVDGDGAMTITYTIRPDAMWADGTPISGTDFAFTAELLHGLADEAGEFSPARMYDQLVPGSWVAGEKSFSVTFQRPTLQWQEMFDPVLPAHDVTVDGFLDAYVEEPWVSAGPFVLASAARSENYGTLDTLLVRNENYWKVDPATGLRLPYLDAVEFRTIPETSALVRAFLDKEVHVINPPPSADLLADLAASGADLQVRPGPIWEHFNFQFGENNRNPDSLNTIADFRRAVAHGIDREAIVDAWRNPEVLHSPFDVGSASYGSSAWARYDHDPQRARELLSSACAQANRDCVANPPVIIFSTTSNADARPRAADLIREQLGEIGIEVKLELEDSSIFFGPTLDAGSWDMGMWAYVNTPGPAGAVTTLEVFDPAGPPPLGHNHYRWGTPAVSVGEEDVRPGADPELFNQGPSLLRDEWTERFAEIVDQARSTLDVGELDALVAEAEAILAEQVIILPLAARVDPGAVWPDRIGNYIHNPSQAGDTWNIEFWYRTDREG